MEKDLETAINDSELTLDDFKEIAEALFQAHIVLTAAFIDTLQDDVKREMRMEHGLKQISRVIMILDSLTDYQGNRLEEEKERLGLEINNKSNQTTKNNEY